MGHHTCCNRQKVKRGLWSPEEDEKLINYISTYGHGCWSSVPRLAGLQRCGKSCRLRWINYLRPDLKRGSFSRQEAAVIIELHRVLGNKWAQIAKHLPGRTDNEVKNFWNSSIKKKIMSAHQNHPDFCPNLANSSGDSSSQTPYFMNPDNNLVPNPHVFDPIELRFDEMMNYHANFAPIPPPPLPFPILGCLPQNIPQYYQHHQIMKQDNNFMFGFDCPNPLLMKSNLETTKIVVPSSSATQEPFLDEIAGFPPPMNAENSAAPPSPLSYIESLIAALESPSPAAASAATGNSSSASTMPPPASSSFSPLPCSSSSFLDDPSFVLIWGPQP